MRRGYINFYAVYIGWLCSAVFLHLPSFQALGLDIRTDLSVLLTIFLLSLLVRPLWAPACWPRCFTKRRCIQTRSCQPEAMLSAERCTYASCWWRARARRA